MKKSKYLVWAIIITIGVFILFWVILDYFIPIESRGAFGDKFGAINALFSALAFAGIIVALRIQSKDFESSLSEIKNNSINNKKQAQIQKSSAKINGMYAMFEGFRFTIDLFRSLERELTEKEKVVLNNNSQAIQELLENILKEIKVLEGVNID